MPIYSQNTKRRELEKLIEKGHPGKADKTTENCFVSSAMITIKKDNSAKKTLDAQNLNQACFKKKATVPRVEVISKILAKFTKHSGEKWMSKNDLDYANGQAELY